MQVGTPRPLPRWLLRTMLALAVFLAVLGVLAGLVRLGWNLPLPHRARLTVEHGPLLVIGFFVTLIGLERAVAVGRRFMLVGPLLAVATAVVLLLGAPASLTAWLSLAALVGFALTFGSLLLVARTVHHAVMFAGALAWLASGFLGIAGLPLPSLVPWWLTGFVLIITGERLELARVFRPDHRIRAWFIGSVVLLVAATALESLFPDLGARLRGAAMLALAAWLVRYDVARRGLRQRGQHRYSALCLLHGYVWLGVAGFAALVFGHQTTGFRYDAEIHAVTLGFVFSQVFAHAWIILPAVAGVRLRFLHFAYAAPLVLGLSLVLRVSGDLLGEMTLRRAGGLGNAFALLLFALAVALGAAHRLLSSSRPVSGRLAAHPAVRAVSGEEDSDACVLGRHRDDR